MVILDNPDPATGLTSLTVQNCFCLPPSGTGSTIDGSNPNADSPDIAVPTLSLTADMGIGTATRALRTQVSTLNAVTGTGGIFIDNNSHAAPATLNIGNGNYFGGGGVKAISPISLTQ